MRGPDNDRTNGLQWPAIIVGRQQLIKFGPVLWNLQPFRIMIHLLRHPAHEIRLLSIGRTVIGLLTLDGYLGEEVYDIGMGFWGL